MRRFWNLILAFLVVLPCLAGCSKESPRRDQAEEQAAPPSPTDTVEEPASTESSRAAWAKPFTPTALPPLAAGPASKTGLAPTKYTDARIGQKATYRVTPERGGASKQIIEIVNTDATTTYAHQTVETKKYGSFVQFLYYNRFVEIVPEADRFNPANQEKYLGDQMVTVGTKKLLCRVYETRNGSSVYRTLLCDDVPDRMVQHSDNAAGIWKTRLQLLDVQD